MIGSARAPEIGLSRGTSITCGNTLESPKPTKEAFTLVSKLTLPSALTLTSRGPTRLPGPLCLPNKIHIGGPHVVNNTKLLSGVINIHNSLTLLADIKLGGDLILIQGMTLKTSITLGGPLQLRNPIDAPLSQANQSESSMQVDSVVVKSKLYDINEILPAGFVIPAKVRLYPATVLPKGTVLPKENSIPSGSAIPAGTELPPNTVIPGGSTLPEKMELQAGTVLPFTSSS